jgi:hypothetical protein
VKVTTQIYFYHIPKFLKNSYWRKDQKSIHSLESIHFCAFSDLSRIMVEPSGIEPLTSCVQSRRSPS